MAVGNKQSNTITVTVNTPCPAPNITQQPTGSTIQQGQQVTLTVVATGTGITFQWFKNGGFVPGATSSSFSDTPTQTSSYFVRVTSSCGTSVDSNAVIVNVRTGTSGGCNLSDGRDVPGGRIAFVSDRSGSREV